MPVNTELTLNKGSIAEYHEWFEESRHGDMLVYFRGDLQFERFRSIPDEDDITNRDERVRLIVLDALADRVKVDAINGFVALTQRKVGLSDYEYRATRLRPERERLRQAAEQSDVGAV